MKVSARWTLSLLGAGIAVGLLAATPVLAQSSSNSKSSGQQQSSEGAAKHWGWFVPKAAPKKATAKPGRAAAGAAPVGKTVSQGGGTTGGRPTVTSVATQTGTPGGVGASTVHISIPGINGGSQTLVDEETHTVRLNDKTTQTTKNIYGQDPRGNRELIAIEKTVATDLGDGKSKAETTYSKLDANGQFTLTRRDVSETVPTGPHSSETNTTIFTPGMSGQMSPWEKIQQTEHKGKNSEHKVSTLLTLDGNGGWQASKKTVTVINKAKDDGQTEEKTLYSPDANGNLTMAQRVVTRNWKAKDGKEHQEVSTYTTEPGGTLTRQGSPLTLMQRVYTVKTIKPDGTVETHERTEERSLVSPSQGLKVSGAVITVAKPTKSGVMSTQSTVFNEDGNGQLRQVSVFGGEQPKPQAKEETGNSGGKNGNNKEHGKKPAAKQPSAKQQH